MAKKITCIITGKTITVSDLYYNKKVSEYGGIEDLSKLYTSREARTLIKRGYSVDECRSLLKVEKKMNEVPDEDLLKIKSFIDDDIMPHDKGVLKSSEDVQEYIKKLKLIYDF